MIDRLIQIVEDERNSGKTVKSFSYRSANQKKLSDEIVGMNRILEVLTMPSISVTNDVIRGVSMLVAENLGLRENIGGRRKEVEPWWKRRIKGDIKKISGHVSILDRKRRGELRKNQVYRLLVRKYKIDRKGLDVVLEELKQKVGAKRAKLKRYEARVKQYQQNRLFVMNQRKVYQELNGVERNETIVPDASESIKFWEGIWSKEKVHNREAEWLGEMKGEVNYEQQRELKIDRSMVGTQCKRMPNWKAAGPDGVQGFWIKRLSSLHNQIADQLNRIVSGEVDLPEWMTCGRTYLCVKDPKKGAMVENFRPITCLPLMWKLLTGMIAESMYSHLEKSEILPAEQKGCKKRSRGTKDQLLIDKLVLKDCKRRHTNLTMAWVDYRKAYDMVPHSWILESLQMFGCASNVMKLISTSMEKWKTELCLSGEKLGSVSIRRGIFQGDSLSPLLFVLCLILRKIDMGYSLKDKKTTINHLLFMDDLKLYGKSENQIESLVNTVYMFSEDIGMEFGVKKCGVLVLKRGKMIECEGVVLPNGETMKEIEEDGYKYLGILEMDRIMEGEMRSKIVKEYFRRLKLILKSKLHGLNKILAINTWASAIMRYTGGIVSWSKTELERLDRKTRKKMTMYGALHPKSDVDRLYLKRKRGGRGLIGCKRCVEAELNNVGWYVKNSAEPLLQEVKKGGVIECEDSVNKAEFKRKVIDETEQRWMEKRMYGQFNREISEDMDKEGSWKWLSKGDLKPETEALICAAQEQALRTNYTKYNIDKTADSLLCRLCGEKGESVGHLVSECQKLAQKEYKRRHDNVARIVHWEFCGKYGIERGVNWYSHEPQGVSENGEVKVLWDLMIQCDHMIECRRPDIVVVDKIRRQCMVIDIAVPGDSRVAKKEEEKIEKYEELRQEIMKIWKMKKVVVVPVVVGALGILSKKLKKWIDRMEINSQDRVITEDRLAGDSKDIEKNIEQLIELDSTMYYLSLLDVVR